MYRNLTCKEIDSLKANLCIAEDWNNVFVKDGFNPKRIFQVSFSGVVKLGNFDSYFELPGGMTKRSGVRYATLHNVEIGDDSCIENIENYISNYTIGKRSYIKNVSLMYVDGVSSFGNGTEVAVLNETGGREVPIHIKLSSHLAYFVTLYRHRPVFQQRIKDISDFYKTKHSSDCGAVGDNVFIINVGKIKNVNICDSAKIEGANLLENGTVNSNIDDPVSIGYNVTCKDFIISSGAKIREGVTVERCFIGQACELVSGFSAIDSLFFSNCFGANGEACSIFAGPYTVTHHKSTLLIAGMFSFMNAGSGSNQSNHMYKLGPIHQGILERGVKTTSDSYILFPAQIGAFSLVMGRHIGNPNTTDLPFSYLIENDNKSVLVPGTNLRSVGTIRDAQKWPNRDNRKDPNRLDFMNFNLLSPFTIQKMMAGDAILKSFEKDKKDEYFYNKCYIASSSLKSGRVYYNLGITKFLGNSIISRIADNVIDSDEKLRAVLKPSTDIGLGDWSDISGLITPKSAVNKLLDDVENGSVGSLQAINERFKEMYDNYYEYEWTWAYSKLFDYFNLNPDTITRKDVIEIIGKWIDAVTTLDRMVYEDAKKEFSLSSMTSFGIDGDRADSINDFEQVRGTFESNKFVSSVLVHIETKTQLGRSVIEKLR